MDVNTLEIRMIRLCILVFSVLLSHGLCAMEDPDVQSKENLDKALTLYRQRNNLDTTGMPVGLHMEKDDQVLRWNPDNKIANTLFGWMYQYQNGEWVQIRKGEYVNQSEFFNSVRAIRFCG